MDEPVQRGRRCCLSIGNMDGRLRCIALDRSPDCVYTRPNPDNRVVRPSGKAGCFVNWVRVHFRRLAAESFSAVPAIHRPGVSRSSPRFASARKLLSDPISPPVVDHTMPFSRACCFTLGYKVALLR